MDIEKLIERLNQYSQSLIAYKLGADFADACMDAATALSALQAENEKLRAELENYRNNHCAEGGCAAEKDRDLVIAENEKLRAELEKVKEYAREATVTMNNLYGACGKFCDETIFAFRQRGRR